MARSTPWDASTAHPGPCNREPYGHDHGQADVERDQEQDLARKGQKHRFRRLTRCLKVVRAHDLEAHERDKEQLHLQREHRERQQVRVGDAEEADDLDGEQVHERPQHHGDDRVAHDAPGQRHLHALEQVRAVVEAEQRLDGDRHADKRQHHERGNALHHADGCQRALRADGALRAVHVQQVVQHEVHRRHACLHGKARQAQRQDQANRFTVQRHHAQTQAHGNALRQAEVPQHRGARDSLAAHGGKRAAHDAHAHDQHEQRIEHGTCNGADDHGAQRAVRGAGGADEVVHAHADALEDEAQADDADKPHSIVPVLGSGARHAEQSIDASRDEHGDSHRHGSDKGKRDRVAQAALGLLGLAPRPYTRRGKALPPLPISMAMAMNTVHDGHCHRGGGQMI